ncbi:MAG TPA: HAD family acid phosphatase [Longimicrobiaceae bacterium]|nr:HAD family acid phosphatase [Longimicrobiaceae bacterium]
MRRLLIVSLALATACTPAVAPPAPPPAPAPAAVPLGLHWFRASAEQRAVYLQVYRGAGERLRALADSLPGGGWAVVLDADETVLDNSTYQKRRAEAGLGFTQESWDAWVREGAAPALPGATEFTRLARSLGGRVAIVTNRDDEVCGDTRENLRRVGVEADVVLCRVGGVSDKNPRFRAVETGTAAPGLPPLRVVMWVGDNIQDFPGLTQAVRSGPEAGFAEFGRRYFLLPNPMYGSWERNPPQ